MPVNRRALNAQGGPQLGSGARSRRAGGYRQEEKRRTRRAMRCAAKADPENAPRKVRFWLFD